MKPARAVAPSVCSSRALHIFRVAARSDIPDAQAAYAEMVDGGEIHPDARAMVIVASGYRDALSPVVAWLKEGPAPLLRNTLRTTAPGPDHP